MILSEVMIDHSRVEAKLLEDTRPLHEEVKVTTSEVKPKSEEDLKILL